VSSGYEATPVDDAQLEGLDISLRKNKHLWMLLLCLDNYADFMDRNSYEEQRALKYSIGNIASEICKDSYFTETVDTGGSIVALLLNIRHPDSAVTRGELTRFSRMIQEEAGRYLDLSVSITVTHNSKGLAAASKLYGNAVMASRYRLFQGKRCIIFENDVTGPAKAGAEGDVITEDMHKRFSQLLSGGNSSEAIEYMIELGDLAEKNNVDSYYSLITMINKSIRETLKPDEEQAGLLSRLQLLQTRVEIESFFARIIEALSPGGEREFGGVATLARKIIDRDHTNPMFSVEQIADELGISVSHLRNIYKERTGSKLIDDITGMRIRHAQRLLSETDHPIVAVGSMVGYPNETYFYRVFKKNSGMTPSEFRQAEKA
jgi:AraC-like DNA-binding protein